MACGGGSGGGSVDLPALHAEPDPERGGRIVDARGREVLLRGVNVNALAEYWQGTDFPTTFPFDEADAERMAAIGWNTVRLLVSWSRIEPAPGRYDEGYLRSVDEAVAVLARHGLYAIIDLHQDAWGPTLAARADEDCAPMELALGWDGAPGWATLDGGQPRCTTAGIRETSPAVVASFAAFFADAEGPGGVGIRARYVGMLAHLAERFARVESVAGYDLMNEPNAFTAEALAALGQFYGDALAAIRAAERTAGGFPHLVLFEPSALWSAVGRGPPPDFVRDRDVVYAPHIYTGGFTGQPITRDAFAIAREEAQRFGGAPVLSGEWGADPRRAEDPEDGYFLDHQALQDEFHFGATLWTWRESCGDPHKVGDIRAGRTPYPWGEFDVDCTTNAIVGERAPVLAQLTRAYVRAAPGRLEATRYDPATGVFEASGVDAERGVELFAFYPAAAHGTPAPRSSGLEDLALERAPGGAVFVRARASGGGWSLHLDPLPGRALASLDRASRGKPDVAAPDVAALGR
jgi:endoglycosylceramidase